MAPYSIIAVPDPVLKQNAAPIEHVKSEEIQAQLKRMRRTLDETGGIGLAANQVGILNRAVLIDVPADCWEFGEETKGVLPIISKSSETPANIFMINPVIMWTSEQESVYEEGCLSIPGQYAFVKRPAHIRVRYIDEAGTEQEKEVSGLESHCVQHEIDHLNGVLFIDHLSNLKKNMILRKFKKFK